MATRSTIALEYNDGTVKSIYCHYDGYLDGVGSTLLEHYTDPAKVDQLMQHGSMSTLGAEIGEQHDFDRHYRDPANKNWCLFYGRDRGENDVDANEFDDYDDYLNNNPGEEFNYIMRDNVWYVDRHQGEFFPLAQVINQYED